MQFDFGIGFRCSISLIFVITIPMWPIVVIICLPDSRSVLNDLYAYTNGPQWTRRNHWGSSSQLERWEGVTVEGIHGWLELSLVENNLSGEMLIISSDIRYCFCEIIFRVLIVIEYHR